MESLQSHPNIIQLCEYFESRAPDGSCMLAIVTEWGEKDLMQDMVQRKTNEFPWSEEDFRYIAFSVVHALAFAERLGIAHRDIKPQNIFYSPIKKVAKLGDFGSATNIYSRTDASLVGTPAYMSAELRTGMRQGAQRVIHDIVKSDVYSLGLTLVVLASLEQPAMNLMAERQTEKTQQKIANLAYSEQVKWLLWEMVNPENELRPTFMQLESKYCPLEENRFSQQYPPQTSSNTPVIVNCPEISPLPQYIAQPLPPASDYPAVPSSVPMGSTVLHQSFKCCEGKGSFSVPVSLCCTSGNLIFCQKSCYREFVERATRDYTNPLKCPICEETIGNEAIKKAFGGTMEQYTIEVYEKGLICVSCNKCKATHILKCGHLYCKSCLELYKTPRFQRRKYICASCSEISSKTEKITTKNEPRSQPSCFGSSDI